MVLLLSTIPLGAETVNAICNLPLEDYPDGASYPAGQCWAFARLVYKRYWGYEFDNNQYSSDNLIRDIPINAESRRATAANLKKYISECPIGSCVRISRTLDYVGIANDGDAGHSFIVVARDDAGFVCYDAAGGRVNVIYYTYDYYASGIYVDGLAIGNAYIKYVKAGSGSNLSPTVVQTENCKYTVTVKANAGKIPLYESPTSYVESTRCFENKTESFNVPSTKKITLSNETIRYYFISAEGHELYLPWNPATMTVVQKHNWSSWQTTEEATCTKDGSQLRYCDCNAIEVKPIPQKGHRYSVANCTTPKTCTVCGATSGSALGHSYTNDCDASCNRCGAARSITHNYAGATCTDPKTCTECGVTTGTSLGHSYTNDCDASCNRCGAARTVTHSYAGATCTDPKTCTVCGVTTGTSLGHSYVTTTTKATFTRPGSVVSACNTCGDIASETTISCVSAVELSATSYTYDGKVKTPSVALADSTGRILTEGMDYAVDYDSGRTAVGTYNVVITLMGDYSGTKVLAFEILPQPVKVTITTQPKTQKVEEGNDIKLAVKATGEDLIYQWQSSADGKTWKNCSSSSAKKATFTFTAKTRHNGNYYRCKVTDSTGNTIYTNTVRTYVLSVTTQPKTQKVEAGDKVKFTVTATGAGKTYQWQYSTDGKTWKNCSSSSATSATFSFTSKTSHSGNYYRCRVKDNAGNTVYTDTVRLYVLGITEQPVSKTVTKGKTAKFTVEATGASKTYQWQYSTNGGKTWKNCSSSSATKATFSFTTKTSHSGNYYRCRIKDSGGNTVYTSKVKLTVK